VAQASIRSASKYEISSAEEKLCYHVLFNSAVNYSKRLKELSHEKIIEQFNEILQASLRSDGSFGDDVKGFILETMNVSSSKVKPGSTKVAKTRKERGYLAAVDYSKVE